MLIFQAFQELRDRQWGKEVLHYYRICLLIYFTDGFVIVVTTRFRTTYCIRYLVPMLRVDCYVHTNKSRTTVSSVTQTNHLFAFFGCVVFAQLNLNRSFHYNSSLFYCKTIVKQKLKTMKFLLPILPPQRT